MNLPERIAGFLLFLFFIPIANNMRVLDHTITFRHPSFPDLKNTLDFSIRQKQIPVLCYHNIKPNVAGSSADYTISKDQFQMHMKMLSDSGYHSILPDQLYNYLTMGTQLPEKPIIISFDDTHEEHFSIAAPILERFGFKGVFFTMTVPIGKPHYMTAEQIKQLSNKGHVIAGHTWNHPDIRKCAAKDWEVQITKPKQKLEQITGKPILYFAYPFGAWNYAAITELKKRNIKAAFQLSGKRSEQEPLYTIRRLMIPGNWSAGHLYKEINIVFK
jgi:peptidoglycan/xylan/chitin deacetylase (PgdA/CDA1 family)